MSFFTVYRMAPKRYNTISSTVVITHSVGLINALVMIFRTQIKNCCD